MAAFDPSRTAAISRAGRHIHLTEKAAALRQRQLERELKKREMEVDLLRTQLEISAIEEEIKQQLSQRDNVHSEQLNDVNPSQSVQSRQSRDSDLASVSVHDDVGVHDQVRVVHSTPAPVLQNPGDETLKQLVDLLSHKDKLPSMEPEVFSGDVLKFPVWLKSFEALIESRMSSQRELLYYLNKYTAGIANAAISGYVMMDSQNAYEKAKRTLVQRFGDKFKLSEAFKREISEWPAIKPGDGVSLQKLADMLQHCDAAMSSTSYLRSLDTAEENKRIVRKLPRYIADRWNRVVDKSLYGETGTGDYPSFSAFCHFLQDEARIACGPGNVTQEVKENPKKEHKAKAKSFASQAEKVVSAPQSASQTTTEKRTPFCILCKGEHYIQHCEKFKSMSFDERKTLVTSKGLCFSCLRRGHIKKDCQRRGKPLFYVGLPPRSENPPKDRPQAQESQSQETTEVEPQQHEASTHRVQVKPQQDCFHSLIVPVVVYHESDPHVQMLTYALLDNQSNACFATDSIVDRLGVKKEAVNLKLTTMLDKGEVDSNIVNGLVIRGISEKKEVSLPVTYTRDCIPIDTSLIPSPETARQWPHLQKMSQHLHPVNENLEVGLLIGFNCSTALMPREIIAAEDGDPYGVKTTLGWGVVGLMTKESDGNNQETHFAFRTHVKEVSPIQVKQMWEQEFKDVTDVTAPYSVEDSKFLKIVGEGIHQKENSHFEIPLPLKDEATLPNNRDMALKRFYGLRAKLLKDDKLRLDYVKTMEGLLEKGYAEEVPSDQLARENRVWYIPHHGVYHPKKPGKLRVVFDCSAQYRGQSINQHLLQGPDNMNNLTGILCRFRKEKIAFVCDIEGMFHQVLVNQEHRDYLRFLWAPDLKSPPQEYRMTVHLFGATSSPGCAIFALKTTADKFESEHGSEASNFIRRDFYMDDGLKSTATVDEAKMLAKDSIEMCAKGGFKLHKFASNNLEVLESIPTTHRAENLQNLKIGDQLPGSRTLGVEWNMEQDEFQFHASPEKHEPTRRSILSTVSSIFDPLGLLSPFLLTGRKILQEIVRDGLSWDDKVPEHLLQEWERWREDVPALSEVRVQRCYKLESFRGEPKVELHHFSDASERAYGQCSYLKQVEGDQVTTSLVMAKSRVAPSKPVTIPRLELMAATLSVKVAEFLHKELDYQDIKHIFWTDSKVVLGYIANEARRFHVFVANRVQKIRDFSDPSQWNYVSTTENPADFASRGMSASEIASSSLWWHGPHFLQDTSAQEPERPDFSVKTNDPEVKKKVILTTVATEAFSLTERLKYFSCWSRALHAVAICLRYKRKLREVARRQSHDITTKPEEALLQVKDLDEAETEILKAVQRDARLGERTQLRQLDSFVGNDGIIRVGGRIRRANIPRDAAHPRILPKGHVTRLIIRYHHKRAGHGGVNTTLNEIRASGYWPIGGKHTIRSAIFDCVTCKKLRARTAVQKMSDLPKDRLEPAPPFTSCGVDFFGPFYIREKRSDKKRWACLFTCMVTRAIHIEVANTLSTDSFINAFRRFVARRGPVSLLRCDRGTNFVGAKNELQAALNEMSSDEIQRELLKHKCDWVTFEMNIPSASHMGGAWERMVRSARAALAALLTQHGERLDDELLHTLLVEAEAIVNSRPLTLVDAASPDQEPLSPMQLLTLKSKVAYPPPGSFVKEDMYCRKRWRCVQFLADEFWRRWMREFLPTLQKRQKWQQVEENIMVNDVVLVCDENLPRSKWPMGRIIALIPSQDSLVRKVKVISGGNVYERPVHKMVFLFRP